MKGDKIKVFLVSIRLYGNKQTELKKDSIIAIGKYLIIPINIPFHEWKTIGPTPCTYSVTSYIRISLNDTLRTAVYPVFLQCQWSESACCQRAFRTIMGFFLMLVIVRRYLLNLYLGKNGFTLTSCQKL